MLRLSAAAWGSIALFCAGFAFAHLVLPVVVWLGAMVLTAGLAMWQQSKDEPDKPRRVGYIGRPGSFGGLRGAKFGDSLDVGIDNHGEIDGEGAEFDVPAEKLGRGDEDEPV